MSTQVEIKKLAGSEVEITGEVSAEEFEKCRAKAVEKLNQEVKLDGFRQGHIPEKMLEEKLGEIAILEEMAELCLQKTYPEIINENKIEAIGRPEVSITKIAKGNPLGFKVKVAVLPEIELPDYKAIAKEENAKKTKDEDIVVDEKELEMALVNLRKMRAMKETVKEKDEKTGEEKDVEKEILPELNDEFAKSVSGGKMETAEVLKSAIKENLLLEKKARNEEVNRLKIFDEIINKSKMELPKIMVEAELGKIMEEIKHNITHMGMKWEDYVAHMKKTEEEMQKELTPDAEKKVKFGVAMHAIARQEKVEVPEEDLKRESEQIVDHYKTHGQTVSLDRARAYVYDVILSEQVFKMLEEVK